LKDTLWLISDIKFLWVKKHVTKTTFQQNGVQNDDLEIKYNLIAVMEGRNI